MFVEYLIFSSNENLPDSIKEERKQSKKPDSKTRSRLRSSTIASTMIIASTTDEEEISKELEKTATILSSSRLAGTYGVGIKAVTCITAGQGEIERGEGQKKGGRHF